MYWINSNSGDYIYRHQDKLFLVLIHRDKPYKMKQEKIEITESQLSTIKGFVPIKPKKFYSRDQNKYRPTLKGGIKGDVVRCDLPPSQAEMRNSILEDLLGN
jgi:hypothetical protein